MQSLMQNNWQTVSAFPFTFSGYLFRDLPSSAFEKLA